jgi:hypothetical protein
MVWAQPHGAIPVEFAKAYEQVLADAHGFLIERGFLADRR